MKQASTTQYVVYVMRSGTMIAYSGAGHNSLGQARGEAKRLQEQLGEGYCEIRKIMTTIKVTLAERVEV